MIIHKMDSHGLGDAVQFTSIIRHLEHYKPKENHIPVVRSGLASIFPNALTNGLDQVPYVNTLYNHAFPEGMAQEDLPATKTVACLHKLKLEPIWELLRYRVLVPDWAETMANDWLSKLSSQYVTLHYQGNTSQARKNLDHMTALNLCRHIRDKGFLPVVFDWDNRCPFVNCDGITRAAIPQEASVIASVLGKSRLNINIDSGVQKLAFAVSAPCLAVWTGHHPFHYCDNAPNAHHLIPLNHSSLIRGDLRRLHYFEKTYSFTLYKDLLPDLIAMVDKYL